MIYFDNSATSFPKPPQVAEAVFNAINDLGAPNRGIYPISMDASRLIYSVRESVAELFNRSDSSQVVFSSGATESLNTAINGLLTADDHVITTVMEHNSVLRPLYRLGCELSFIPCDDKGRLLLDEAEKLLKPNTKAIVVNHVSNVTGNATDIHFLSRLCVDNGLYLILDCAQSAGRFNIDANIADVICFTGHKSLFGPQGTGGMIVKDGVLINPLKVGGAGHHSSDKEHPQPMPDRLEAGIQNCHSLAGLFAGIKFIKHMTVEKIAKKESDLAKRFVDGVSGYKNIKLYGDFFQQGRGAVVSLLVEGYGSAEITETLAAQYNIATRSGMHCAPLLHKALGTEKTGLTRFSFSWFNTFDEVDFAVEVLGRF
ncbi:MAG: aminotransferase class V-fold PLP-dependent enzyme [Defluviitaleaceae bacterium]|nr:aminotransferase class V-fold PLP-dependent enzyme [Defluviitaleaceae bacterium]